MSRPIPLPASPHLRESHVLKMLNEEGQEIKSTEAWPPKGRFAGAPRPHDFLSKCGDGGNKKVAWPPHLDYEGINEDYLSKQDPDYQRPTPQDRISRKDQVNNMNQQSMSSQRQETVSSSSQPGGGYKIVNESHQINQYQYEQSFHQQQPSISMQYQLKQNQIQAPYKQFQVPIKKTQTENTTQRTFMETSNNVPGQSQPYETKVNIQYQNKPQNQFPQPQETNVNIQYHKPQNQFKTTPGNQFQNMPQSKLQNEHQNQQFQGLSQPQNMFQNEQVNQFQNIGPEGMQKLPHNQFQHGPHKNILGHTAQNIPQQQFQGQTPNQFQDMQAKGGENQVNPLKIPPPKKFEIRNDKNKTENVNDLNEWPPKNDSGVNLTTTYPSGFKLREEAPMSQPGQQTVPSQPAFKMTKPMKMRGDAKWPPGQGDDTITQEEVREFIRPKKATKDYSEFFAQNALPNNYPGYRVPPGTQHRNYEEEPEE